MEREAFSRAFTGRGAGDAQHTDRKRKSGRLAAAVRREQQRAAEAGAVHRRQLRSASTVARRDEADRLVEPDARAGPEHQDSQPQELSTSSTIVSIGSTASAGSFTTTPKSCSENSTAR